MQNPVTDKQLKYIAFLLDTKQVPEDFAEHARGPLDRSDASKVITQLQGYPKKALANGSHDWSPDVKCEIPKHGTYTVVFGDEYRTVRIRKPHPKANFTVAEYLFGPDNSNDFKRFAREVPGGFRFVPGFDTTIAEGNLLGGSLRALISSTDTELEEMGFSYALKSGNCYRCGRKLTVPASIHRGLGPVCAGKE